MTHKRFANKVDANQPHIVTTLRGIPGVTVELDHDDILVGYQGRTYWYEIKDPDKTLKKDGTWRKGALKKSQIRIESEFTGHYKIVTDVDQILDDMGIVSQYREFCKVCEEL